MAVRFGVVGYPATFSELREQATEAERAGFDGWFFSEHHQRTAGYHFGSNLEAMAAVAACTSRIRLGTCILLLSLHQPIALAESTAVVDRISNGRLILGVGLGYQREDFDALGVDRRQRVSRFEEGLVVLRQAWARGRVSFQGRRYQFQDVVVHPRPVQASPPVWIGAWSEAAVRRAARMGDGWVADPLHSITAIQKLNEIYREEAANAGREPYTVLTRFVVPGSSRDDALRRAGPVLAGIFRFYFENRAFTLGMDPWMDSVRSADDITAGSLAAERVAAGSPKECADQLRHWGQVTGAQWLLLTFVVDFARAHQETLATLRAFGDIIGKSAGGRRRVQAPATASLL